MKKWNAAAVRAAKGREKLGCTTAYDSCFARLADEAGVPVILVGDSMGMTVLGYDTTLNVTMGEMLSATAAVARAAKSAMVVADLPFGSYQCGEDEAVRNAVACIKAGADAVKLEGGARVSKLIRRLTEAGIPVLAHVGMTPQSVNEYGGFKRQGVTREAAEKLDEILSVRGIDEVHIGLNDLHLSLGEHFMFEPLADGPVDKLTGKIAAVGLPYGFGGIARIGYGMLPAEKVITEHYRLGSSFAILSRSFCNIGNITDEKEVREIFGRGVKSIRDFEDSLSGLTPSDYEENRLEVKRLVNEIVGQVNR